MIGVLAFLVAAAFWPSLAAAGTAPRWALLAVAVPLMFPKKIKFTAGHLALLIFVAWSVSTLFWTDEPLTSLFPWHPSLAWIWVPSGGVNAIVYWTIFSGLFCIGAELSSFRPVFIGMALGLSLSSIVAIAQFYFGWTGIDQYSVPGGLFINPNFMAEIAVMVLIGLIAERLYWFIPLVLPAVLLPQSRSALLALVIALALWTRSRAVMAVMIIGIGAAAIWSIQTGFRLPSVQERLDIWRDTIDGMAFFGRGLGSFYVLYPAAASRTDTLYARPDHAHNEIIETLFETGIPGILLIGAFLLAAWYGRNRAARLVLVAFAVSAMASFPLHVPASMFLVALVAGNLSADGPALRFHQFGRGMVLRARTEAEPV